MELAEQEKKEIKRLRDFSRKTRKFNMVGGIISIILSIVFVGIGLYYIMGFLPKFSNVSGPAIDELKMVYTLWCYTFILLGIGTFLTGYLLLQYCKDVYFLFCLWEKASLSGQNKVESKTEPTEKGSEQENSEEKQKIEESYKEEK